MKTIFILLLSVITSSFCFSQTSLSGTVTDAESDEPIIFGTIALYQNDVLITGIETDFDGFYTITEINSGIYDVVFSYTGYAELKITDVIISEGKINELNVKMNDGLFYECIHSRNVRPLIQKDNLTRGHLFDKRQISKIAF